jgi:hypothetical protein
MWMRQFIGFALQRRKKKWATIQIETTFGQSFILMPPQGAAFVGLKAW